MTTSATKTAIITGASGGIRRAVALRLARDGFAVVVNYAGKKRIRVETDLEGTLPMTLADRIQIQQVLINLVHNAIEAKENVNDRPRLLSIRSRRDPANGDARFKVCSVRVLRRRGAATAKVAVGRKILTIIYTMLKNNEPFRGRSPRQRILAKAWSKKTKEVSGYPPRVMIQA